MADAKSNYLENALLNHVLRATTYTPPTTLYLALFTTDPTDSATGTEVTGGSYARKVITFAAASGGTSNSSVEVTFPTLPAGTITHAAIYDALTGGNMLYYKALNPVLVLQANDNVVFSSGNVSVSEA